MFDYCSFYDFHYFETWPSLTLTVITFQAVVIGHEPGKGRFCNATGALRCRMENGKEFSVGSG